jgi:hypothetical protein
VESFGVASSNLFNVWVAEPWFALNSQKLCGSVFGNGWLESIVFDDLAEIDPVSKNKRDGHAISCQPVRAELKTAYSRIVEAVNKRPASIGITLANVEREDHFAVLVDSQQGRMSLFLVKSQKNSPAEWQGYFALSGLLIYISVLNRGFEGV